MTTTIFYLMFSNVQLKIGQERLNEFWIQIWSLHKEVLQFGLRQVLRDNKQLSCLQVKIKDQGQAAKTKRNKMEQD